jgi:hypothetical protein
VLDHVGGCFDVIPLELILAFIQKGSSLMLSQASAEVVQDGDQQTEVAFAGFVRRQQLLRDLGQIIDFDARFVVRG